VLESDAGDGDSSSLLLDLRNINEDDFICSEMLVNQIVCKLGLTCVHVTNKSWFHLLDIQLVAGC